MRLSLRWRITIPFVLLILFTSGLISIFLSQYFEQIYLENVRSEAVHLARVLASQSAPFLSTGSNVHNTQSIVQLFSSFTNTSFLIVLPDGSITAQSGAYLFNKEKDFHQPDIQQALAGKESTRISRSPENNDSYLEVFEPVMKGDAVTGMIWLVNSLNAYEGQMDYLQKMILIMNGAAALLAVLLVMALSNYTIRPLRHLTRAAQWMAEGDFTKVSLNNQSDEIGQLNQAFNQMAGQINAQFSELTTERVKLAAVLSNMTDGIMIVDYEGITRLINPACIRMFKVAQTSPVGLPLVELVRSHQIYDLWQQCHTSGEQKSLTFELSIDRLFINAIASPLSISPAGNVLLVFQDLTRLHRLEMVRRDFVSNVSHELRTPLASLKAITETLREGALDDPTAAKRFLLRMEIEIDALAQMVQELLELSRIESGKVPLDKQPIAPAMIIEAAYNRMQHQAERAGINLSYTVPEDLPLVNADRARIIQVMVNLLHNAVKFTPPGGEISMTAEQKKKMVVFQIKDTGIGIDPEALPRIFERFYKVDRARTGEGTGLGLSISRHLIEAHNGTIWAESEVGKGSTFHFSLPIS